MGSLTCAFPYPSEYITVRWGGIGDRPFRTTTDNIKREENKINPLSCISFQAVNKDNVKYTPGLTYTAEALQQARMNLYREGGSCSFL